MPFYFCFVCKHSVARVRDRQLIVGVDYLYKRVQHGRKEGVSRHLWVQWVLLLYSVIIWLLVVWWN